MRFAADQADVSFSLRYLRSMQIHLAEFHGKDWTEVLHRTGAAYSTHYEFCPPLRRVHVGCTE